LKTLLQQACFQHVVEFLQALFFARLKKYIFKELYDSLKRIDFSAVDSIPFLLPKNLLKASMQESCSF
jgi:hypothetical protein